MQDWTHLVDGANDGYPSPISTGDLPPHAQVRELVEAAYQLYKDNTDGVNANHYPALANVPAELFGVALVSAAGTVFEIGDTRYPFTIMSVAKPFIFALVCQTLGAGRVRELVGMNSTGMAFNSVVALELHPQHLSNPMVNAGAIATTSLMLGETAEAKWASIHNGLSRFAGRTLSVNEEVYASASASNHRNHALVRLLQGYGRVSFDPLATLDLYTRQSSLEVTTHDLAVMAATLADGGVNPITGERVVEAHCCQPVLAAMATAGMYETSGDWLFDVGLPGKSGVGGGIITVAPGKGGLATFAPPLDQAGNSVKGQLVTRFLAARLGLNVFASQPTTAAAG
ncbi:MAG: glutaminase A [Chloroflexaceae bacterium]|nr:glutaminase A [Chloroflexaceae bacterium]